MGVASRIAYSLHHRWSRLVDERARALLRAKLGAVGPGGTLGRDLHVTCPERVRLGANVHIGRGAWIRANGGLRVEDNTHISRNCVIFTVNHDWHGARLPYDDVLLEREVVIGANVWIGMNVCIAPGAHIGEGAIIGMGTVVTGDVPPLAIIGGQKWRVLGERDREHYERLKREGRFGGADGVAWPAATGAREPTTSAAPAEPRLARPDVA